VLLEIASGERPFEDGRGWVHNDHRALSHIEYVCDCRVELLEKLGRESCDELRAAHVLEHFGYTSTVDVLGLWKEMLKPGGKLHIEVPNMAWQIQAHSRGEITDEEFVYYAYGEQNYDSNYHCAGFTKVILRDQLEKAGFSHVTVTDIGQVLVALAIK
jgi:predicted SAM-dependent methyltransferase